MRIAGIREFTASLRSSLRSACVNFSQMTVSVVAVVTDVIRDGSARFQMMDIWVALLFGVLGYIFRKTGFPLAPTVLASVLVQMMETPLKQSLIRSGGSPLIFFARPISGVIMVVTLLFVGRSLWTRYSGKGVLYADETD